MDNRKRGFDEVEKEPSAPHWADIRLLYEAADSFGLPALEGQAFHVALDGRAVFETNRWLLSGHLLASWMGGSSREGSAGPKVVVAVSETVYASVVAHTSVLRILQAKLTAGTSLPIIDTCSGLSVVAGTSLLQCTETIEVAELFCGGFNGWSQGVKVLRSFGYKCRTRWLLDTAQECFEGSRQVNPGLQAIYNQEELLQQCSSQDLGFICTNLESPWWLQGLVITAPQVICVSAPCQPWSVGGLGSGLDSEEGRLLLHVFGQMAFLQPAVIVLEQVPGFRKHPHFDQVQQAWIEAGYREAWASILDMVDVAPTSRRPTLGSFDCILRLPHDMHEDCVLDEATLAKYLDPWFLPPPQHNQHHAQSPQAFRFRGLSDRASCFVAQYHYQHELSDRILERAGLFGILLELPHEVRFFSGAEVALMHGAISPIWLPKDDRVQMRLMGNGISIFHAVIPLTLAFQVIGPRSLRVSTAQAILQGMAMRIKASQARILDLKEGWVLCRAGTALQSFIEAHHTWVPRQQLPDPSLRFGRFVCVGRAETCHFVVSPAVALPGFLALLGHEFPAETYAQLQLMQIPLDTALPRDFDPPGEAQLDLETLPPLPLPSCLPQEDGQDLLLVIGQQAYYVLHRNGPTFFWEMAQTMAMEGWRQADFFETDDWFSREGCPVEGLSGPTGLLQGAECSKPAAGAHLRPRCNTALQGRDRLRIPETQVQVQGDTFWFGYLPTSPSKTSDDLTLGAASLGPSPFGFINSGGWLLVTFMPETRGGGAKDAKFRSAQKGLAQPPPALRRRAEAARRRAKTETKVRAADFVLLPGFFKNADIYDYPHAAAKNDLLLAWAYQRATLSCVPALVAGDFNTCPTELTWQAFQGLGWVELGSFASLVHGLHLPSTFKGATRYDTFLLPPSLFQFFSSADVMTDEHVQMALVPEASPVDKLRLWSATVEEAVSVALRKAAAERSTANKHAPLVFLGLDVMVIRSRPLKTHRQLRRLTTFKQGLAKHLRGAFRGPLAVDGWPVSLHREWGAICRASGYGPSFSSWVLQWPCFSHFPLHRPDLDFLTDITSLVKFDVDALQRQAVAVKCKLFRFQLQVDASDFGGSKSFVRIKPPEKPPFTCVLLDYRSPARLIQRHSFQLCTFQVQAVRPFELLCQVSFAQIQGQVTSAQDDRVTVLFPADDDFVLPTCGELRRLRHDSSWEGVIGSLMEYWCPIYRDNRSEATDLENWPGYQHLVRLLSSPCPTMDINMTDTSAWLHVARGLSPRKATGVCGWHNKDLRLLPAEALADLASIMQQLLPLGFPDFLMKARVAVLSKVQTPDSAAQALVEESLCERSDLSGLQLSAAAPLCDLLMRLGLPSDVAQGWGKSLTKVSRSFQIHGSLGPELPSTTGAPEGDPTSVLGMIAVCWLFVELLQGVVSPKAYVDNLSWTSDDPENHAPALLILEDFRQALSLEIDWQKTYQWATSPVSRTWWLTVGVDFLPGSTCLVDQVKELGSYFQFTRRRSRGPFQQRLQEALQRLSKLGSDSQGLPTKAQVVQGGVWPFLFFGTKGLAPPTSTVHTLRSAAARAIVGPHHILSPYAAMCFLPAVQDPEIFLLCHHVSQLRRAFATTPSTAALILQRLTGPSFSQRTVCGPASALQVLLARNDWTVQADGLFRGPLHCRFHLHSASARQVRNMFQLAWGSQVQDQIQHRNGLSTAPTPHAQLSAASLASFRPWEQKFLARSMCGGFMSGAERNTWSRDSTDLCPLCHELDTRAHRIFCCPALQDKRAPHMSVLAAVQAQLPHWTYMPYVSWPYEASVLKLLLAQLRLPAVAGPVADQHVYLFTDASAIHTKCPSARVTAWAVVRGQPPSSAPNLTAEDTVPRAELAALAWASAWAQQQQNVSVDIWTDCQPALDLWHRWCRYGWEYIRGSVNADLLRDVPRPTSVQAHKIKAHRSSAELSATPYWDQWLAAGNAAADEAAKQACRDLPAAVHAMSDQVASASCRLELLERLRNWRVPPSGLLSVPEAWEESWANWPFGLTYGRLLLQWLQRLRWHKPPAAPDATWEVSYLEMLLSFCDTANTPPLVENVFQPGSYWSLVQAKSQLQHVSVRQMVTCFRAALIRLGSLLQHTIFPCAEVKDIAHLRFFRITSPNPGLAARPFLPGNGWVDLLEQ
ncbi:unnamed protein product, partial [Symbiodinium sp. CCMP2456]